eukprot:13913662-Alexandrium_andersonii.AAC.1
MSASLVGSEMCIRDSIKTTQAGHSAGARQGVPPGNVPRAHVWVRARGASVSYTHLTLPTICSV